MSERTSKEKIAELYAKSRGWWDEGSNDFCSSDVRGACNEFANDCMNITAEEAENE